MFKKVFIYSVFIFMCLFTSLAFASPITLSEAPDYNWWYGCTPTSAGMLMGYYDRKGYNSLGYDNILPGYVAAMETFTGTDPAHNATNNMIASPGHISDFYRNGYMASDDDLPPPWHSFNSLADFMGTSQDSVNSSNGSSWIYNFNNGSKLTKDDAYYYGIWNFDAMYGIYEFLNYRGYGVNQLYNQYVDTLGLDYGFSFADFQDEIDNGRPVLVHVEGHTVFGYGYDAQYNQIFLHDTWSLGQKSMTWGGSYSGLGMFGVTVLELAGGEGNENPVPEPGTIILMSLGIFGLGIFKLRNIKNN